MLHTIPFHASLLGRPLTPKKKATNSHILLYGAIEVHSMGHLGCIAGNKTLSEDTGISQTSIARYLKELKEAGWIDYSLDKACRRGAITPRLTIQVPPPLSTPPTKIVEVPQQKLSTPPTKIVDIDKSIDKILDPSDKSRIEIKKDKYPKEDYTRITQEYVRIKNVSPQGKEWLPIQKEIKLMFESGRTVEEIIQAMEICNHNYDDWAMSTVRAKIPDTSSGKLRKTTKNKFGQIEKVEQPLTFLGSRDL